MFSVPRIMFICFFCFQPILKAGDEVDEPSERERLRTVLKRMGKLRCMREVRVRAADSALESQVCLPVVLSPWSSASLSGFLLLCSLVA